MSAVDKAPEMPNWEGFGLAIMEDWGAHCDTEASVRFDLAIKFGILRPIAGGFDPDTHVDDHGDAERGDPWFELNRRADLTAPSAPAEVEGLRSIIAASNNVIDGLTAENTALQFENARLTAELAAEKAKRGARLETAAEALAARKYQDADEHAEHAWNAALDRGIVEIRALDPDATAALDQIVKQAVDAETRACAEVCMREDIGVTYECCHAAILARLDQRKEAGA